MRGIAAANLADCAGCSPCASTQADEPMPPPPEPIPPPPSPPPPSEGTGEVCCCVTSQPVNGLPMSSSKPVAKVPDLLQGQPVGCNDAFIELLTDLFQRRGRETETEIG